MAGAELEAIIESDDGHDEPPTPIGAVIICAIVAVIGFGTGGAAWYSDFEKNFGVGGVLVGMGAIATVTGFWLAKGK